MDTGAVKSMPVGAWHSTSVTPSVTFPAGSAMVLGMHASSLWWWLKLRLVLALEFRGSQRLQLQGHWGFKWHAKECLARQHYSFHNFHNWTNQGGDDLGFISMVAG